MPAKRAIEALTLAAGILAVPVPALAQDGPSSGDSLLAAEILEELIEIPSVSGTAETVEAAEAMAERLRAAGFPEEDVHVLEPEPGVGILVARHAGTGGRPPILLLAHLDVVPANPEDWSLPPFELTEQDGWWYGRGTSDNKAGAAMLIANFIRYRQERFVPDRDLIVVLTGDEETNSDAIKWVLTGEGREFIDDPAYALNTDSGGGSLHDGQERMFGVQASEKVYLSFQLEVINPGGHSSQPRPDNAITMLAQGLVRLSEHAWPVRLNEVTRAFFERSAALESGRLAADMRAVAADPPDTAAARRLSESPHMNALLRTTCVATMLEAGHAENALPQSARATVNCRILPGESADAVERTLVEVLGDPEIRVNRLGEPTPSPPSPLTDEVLGTIERLAAEMWPGVPVIPTMSTGATDGLYVRNAGIPVYGVAAIFEDTDDQRAHGKDERIEIKRFYEALRFWYRMARELAGARAPSGSDGTPRPSGVESWRVAHPARRRPACGMHGSTAPPGAASPEEPAVWSCSSLSPRVAARCRSGIFSTTRVDTTARQSRSKARSRAPSARSARAPIASTTARGR